MRFHRAILRGLNFLFNLTVILLLLCAGTYSAFALWDNERVYAAAGDVQADMIRLKPQLAGAGEEDTGPDFSQLLQINEDVCAWLTMDGTQIDYPILQGSTNNAYLNTDVYGDFALAGSIFLDSRNSRDFTDAYSLIYGHHMAERKMFGDLDLYKQEDFFRNHRSGFLILPGQAFQLEVISCLVVAASEEAIFDPTHWQDSNISGFLEFIGEKSLYVHQEVLDRLCHSEEPFRIVSLSTCASEFTDARTIVLTVMTPYTSEESGG